jgi:hypothetical protein
MANLNEMIGTGQLCCCFRAKTMFYEVESAEDAPAGLPESSSTYGYLWCLQTQSVLGPDGSAVDVETCRPGRGCCTTV